MSDPGTGRMDDGHSAALGRRYLVQFEEDTVRERPLWMRVIVEFIGTAVLVTVAAGAGVINNYAGDSPVTRAAAVTAPGAAVMAMIYAWGPLCQGRAEGRGRRGPAAMTALHSASRHDRRSPAGRWCRRCRPGDPACPPGAA